MGAFTFNTTSFSNVFLIDNFYTEDNRGYFIKDFEKEVFTENGIDIDFFECFESHSKKNVIRGLHFQTCEPQAKLVRVITGHIYDVIVDLRANSNTFGQWQGFYLSEDNHKSLFIPKGFAHGFCTKSDNAIVSYKCVGQYLKGTDNGIIWNDKDLSINWGINNPIISERDKALMTLKEFIENYRTI